MKKSTLIQMLKIEIDNKERLRQNYKKLGIKNLDYHINEIEIKINELIIILGGVPHYAKIKEQ